MILTKRGRKEAPLRVLVYGAGGHGTEVAAAIRALGHEAVVRGGKPSDPPLTYVADLRDLKPLKADCWIVAIGDNAAREAAHVQLRAILSRETCVTVVHPSAWVDDKAALGSGVYVAAGAVVQPSEIQTGCIINTGAVVSHGAVVGPFSHIAPHATLCGDVVVGGLALVGAGAVVRPGCRVGLGCVVGCGAAVTTDLMAGWTYVGVPARRLRRA